MLRLPIFGDRLLLVMHTVYTRMHRLHHSRVLEPAAAPAARAGGQPHLHDGGDVLRVVRRQQRRGAGRRHREASRLSPASPGVQLSVYTVHIPGGDRHLSVQPRAGAVYEGAREYSVGGAAADWWSGFLHVLLNGDQQSLSQNEDVLLRDHAAHVAAYTVTRI